MKPLLSTLMFQPNELEKAIGMAQELGIMLEIFPMWNDEEFTKFTEERWEELNGIVYSFHEPYFGCDQSFAPGTEIDERTQKQCLQTFELSAKLGGKHIVFHHNNRQVTPENREEMLKNSAANLEKMNELAEAYGVQLLVENAGNITRENVLFNEEEFIQLFDTIPNKCLFDIGHAHVNGWDIERVMRKLQHRIVGYHLNDNDRSGDQHELFGKGGVDIVGFHALKKELTPDAVLVLEHADHLGITVDDIRKELEMLD